jgi:glucose-6-phosphate 1-epimerase
MRPPRFAAYYESAWRGTRFASPFLLSRELQPVMSTSSAVRIDPEQIGALPCWRVTTPHGVARVARQGAQLLSYEDSLGRPLVWVSGEAAHERGQAVRGGVPVCWPWFGDYSRNPQAVRDTVGAGGDAPAHGLVRGRDWELSEQNLSADTAELVFSFDATRDLAPWRHPAKLSLTMRFGEKIGLALTVHNLGEQALTQSLALHTYLAVSDSRQIQIDGLDGAPYIDTVGQWQQKTQQGPLRIEAETDRIYQPAPAAIVIRDPGWRRAIHVVSQHSASAVLWNPWVEKSQRLSHFANDDWQRMVCVETARVLDDALVVAPGASATVSVSLHTEAE